MFCMSGLDKEGTIFCKLTFPGLDIYKLCCKYPASDADCVCRVKQQCLSLDSASGRLWDLDLGHFALLLHEEFLRTSTQTLSNGEQNMENNITRTRESTKPFSVWMVLLNIIIFKLVDPGYSSYQFTLFE